MAKKSTKNKAPKGAGLKPDLAFDRDPDAFPLAEAVGRSIARAMHHRARGAVGQ